MVRNINLSILEKEVREVLEDHSLGTTVELFDLSVNTYERLKIRFSGKYEVRGIINLLRAGNQERSYVLHIRKQNA